MYENIFDYEGELEGNDCVVMFKPNFREEITTVRKTDHVYSNGKITLKDTSINEVSMYDVRVSEGADWFLVIGNWGRMELYVMEGTKEIQTSFEASFNRKLNQIFKKAKWEYHQKKKNELRLYFYNVEEDWLSSSKITQNCNGKDLKYRPIEPFHEKVVIDGYCEKPHSDCFILGRVKRTIGIKNSKLMDFIEPVHIFKPDFSKGRDIFAWDEYMAQLEDLEFALENLLEFTMKKKYHEDDMYCKRVASYQKLEKIDIDLFNAEILKAFESENVAEVRRLYDVLETPQDCSNVKFGLHLKKNLTCGSCKAIPLYFENGEYGAESAKWVFQNIDRCIDAKAGYLGDLSGKYEFELI